MTKGLFFIEIQYRVNIHVKSLESFKSCQVVVDSGKMLSIVVLGWMAFNFESNSFNIGKRLDIKSKYS